MKEKTFDELINEKENVNVPNFIHFNDVLELIQQVREATIAECQQKVTYRIGCYLGADKLLYDLPTDRIKIDEKA